MNKKVKKEGIFLPHYHHSTNNHQQINDFFQQGKTPMMPLTMPTPAWAGRD